jgi:ribonuclease D
MDTDDVVEPAAVPLLAPRDGLSPLVETEGALRTAVAAIAGGSGPIAVDAERASGYRYSARAYLIQLRRAGTGTVLIDPIPFGRLDALAEVMAGTEWVLHAASQDLACLAEVGLVPSSFFDTELAARLLGYPRVGLGPLVEQVLGLHLEKGYSAADWSRRPLPEPWLVYAALDVEVLVELRDRMAQELVDQGKAAWAEQEFAHVLATSLNPPPPRQDPWRRTSGLHKVRKPRQLAVVRALWSERDRVARRRDIAPGRILPDPCIVEVAAHPPESREDLGGRKGFTGRAVQRELNRWWGVVREALAEDEAALPRAHRATDPETLPPPRSWPDRRPEAAGRLERARAAMAVLSQEHNVPVENLMLPDLVRRLCWEPPEPITPASVADRLVLGQARPWQVTLAADPLATALVAVDKLVTAQASADSAEPDPIVAASPGGGRAIAEDPDGD